MDLNCKVNFIPIKKTSGDENVSSLRAEDVIMRQPDASKLTAGLFNFCSEKKRGGISENATCSKLVLDYDNGMPRSKVMNLLKDYDYLIYSSTGNSKSLGLDKFRIILELKEPVKYIDLKHNKEKLLSYFEGVDDSTFDFRFFVRPTAYDKDHDPVIILFHEGKPFDFYSFYTKTFAPFEKLKQQMQDAELRRRLHHKSSQKHVDWYIDWLKARERHWTDILGAASKARMCGLDEDEGLSLFLQYYRGSQNEKSIRENFRKCFFKSGLL